MKSLASSGVLRIATRVSWTVVDQVLSALSNVLLAVLVARAVDADGFGSFSTAFLVFSLIIGLTRSAVGQPLQITFAAADPVHFLAAVRSALGASMLIGAICGLIAAAAGLALAGETGQALLALAVCLPGLLVQDTCRMAFFASGQPRNAAAIDALWAVLLFSALAAVLAAGVTAIWVPIVVWGIGATLAALAGIALLRAIPRLRGAVRWTLEQRRLTGYLLAEYVLGQGIAQVGILMVAVIGTEAGVGALRAAQVLLGPLNILGAAAFMFAVPEIARRPSMSQRGRAMLCVGVSAAMALATVLYCGILLLLPNSIGEELLGDTWTGAESVLLAMCVLSLSAALATGPAAVLYGIGLARVTFFVNIIKAPLLVVLMGIGIPLWGAEGAAWAIAATETALLPLWFWRVRTALRASRPAITTEPREDVPTSAESATWLADDPLSKAMNNEAAPGVPPVRRRESEGSSAVLQQADVAGLVPASRRGSGGRHRSSR